MIANKFYRNILSFPKRLFIIDGLGAIVSAISLGVVLVHFQSFFGIPKNTLYILASFPVGFALFDLLAYSTDIMDNSSGLRLIATVNIFYSLLSISLVSFHRYEITVWGWLYIWLEIFIVVALSFLEYRVAKRLKP